MDRQPVVSKDDEVWETAGNAGFDMMYPNLPLRPFRSFGDTVDQRCNLASVQLFLGLTEDMSLESVPLFPLLNILRYIGRPADFSPIFLVCKSWRDHFDCSDANLWNSMSCDYYISIPSTALRRTLRSTSDHRRAFFRAYYKKLRETNDKHDLLILQAKSILHQNRDRPASLEKLIISIFPNVNYFDPNYRCKTMEDNSLLTLACRNGQQKCIKLLVERYNADTNIADVGGFTPLILCAYHGNFNGVIYLLGKGASIRAVGKLRSGLPLTAEHWAALQGHMEIFRYLHALRRRFVRRAVVADEQSELNGSQLPALSPVQSVIDPTVASKSATADTVAAVAVTTSSLQASTTAEPIRQPLSPPLLLPNDYFDMVTSDFDLGFTSAESTQSTSWSELPEPLSQPKDITSYIVRATEQNMGVHIGEPSSSSTASAQVSESASNPASSTEVSTFCYCRKGFEGQMIGCDDQDCAVEWFHFDCVGLHARPLGKWYCPPCGVRNSGTVTTADEESVQEEYCVCGRGYVGRMVGCDNASCLVEWFHFQCVNLSAEPTGHWKCPACSGTRFVQPTSFAQPEAPQLTGCKRGVKRGRAGRPPNAVRSASNSSGSSSNRCDSDASQSGDVKAASTNDTALKHVVVSGLESPEKRQRHNRHTAPDDPVQSPLARKSAFVSKSSS